MKEKLKIMRTNIYDKIKKRILSSDLILKTGINDDDLEWNLILLQALNPNDNTPFNGIAYCCDENGNIIGYTEYKNGIEVEFYTNGNIKSYSEMTNRFINGTYCEFTENKECTKFDIYINGKIKESIIRKEFNNEIYTI